MYTRRPRSERLVPPTGVKVCTLLYPARRIRGDDVSCRKRRDGQTVRVILIPIPFRRDVQLSRTSG